MFSGTNSPPTVGLIRISRKVSAPGPVSFPVGVSIPSRDGLKEKLSKVEIIIKL
jgi:hypothetical protein